MLFLFFSDFIYSFRKIVQEICMNIVSLILLSVVVIVNGWRFFVFITTNIDIFAALAH